MFCYQTIARWAVSAHRRLLFPLREVKEIGDVCTQARWADEPGRWWGLVLFELRFIFPDTAGNLAYLK